MANEIPYEELNTLHVGSLNAQSRMLLIPYPQNKYTEHGRARYVKGAVQTRSLVSTTQTVFDKSLQVTASGDLSIVILFEYLPVAEINGPPTALCRRPGYNVLTLATWDKDTPENQKAVQDVVRNIADILAKSQTDLTEAEKVGYGNYGK